MEMCVFGCVRACVREVVCPCVNTPLVRSSSIDNSSSDCDPSTGGIRFNMRQCRSKLASSYILHFCLLRTGVCYESSPGWATPLVSNARTFVFF